MWQNFSKAMNMLRSQRPAGLASEYTYRFGGKKTFPTKTKEKIEQDKVYAIPGKVDKMTAWLEEGRKRVHKYYLNINLKGAYALT